MGARAGAFTAAAMGMLLMFIVVPDYTPPLQSNPGSRLPDVGKIETEPERWVIRTMSSDYELGRDDAGRSTLHAVETIDAVFQEERGGTGIVRYLVGEYNGSSTDARVISVTDAEGVPVDYELGEQGPYVTVTTTSTEVLDGDVVYVIEYELSNVTTTRWSTNRENQSDHFEWNAFGPWKQPAAEMAVSVTLDRELQGAVRGQVALLYSVLDFPFYSEVLPQRAPGTYSDVLTTNLPGSAFVGPVMQFVPGTFATHDVPPNRPLILALAWIPFGLVALFLLANLYFLLRSRVPVKAAGAADPTPPEGLGPLDAAGLMGGRGRALESQFLDFAARGVLYVVEAPPSVAGILRLPSGRWRFAERGVQPLDPTPWDAELYRASFPHRLREGESLSASLAVRLSGIGQPRRRGRGLILRAPLSVGRRLLMGQAPVALAIVQMAFHRQASDLMTADQSEQLAWMAFFALVMAFVSWLAVRLTRPVTAAGHRAAADFAGVHAYMLLPRDERRALAVDLQATDERLVGYAWLWRLEHAWATDLATGYASRRADPPGWYTPTASPSS